MNKAIIIGNGFTSNLIDSYLDIYMMHDFYSRIPNLIDKIEENFNIFRNPNLTTNDIYTITEAPICSPELICSNDLFIKSDGIHIQEKTQIWVIDKLKALGFSRPEKIFDEYFENYGLVYLIKSDKIIGVESYLKIVHMFSEIGLFSEDEYNNIKSVANEVYFNKGNHGIKSLTNKLIDISKLSDDLTEYDIYTTNYDTILDDLLEYQNRFPFHLHGGFSVDHLNKEPDGRYTPDKAKLIWGHNAESKYSELRVGMDFNDIDFNAFRFGDSLISDYFDYLSNRNYEELYILGFSGENDDHINRRIRENPNIKRVIVYVNPNKINNPETKVKSRMLFSGDNKALSIKSWEEFWKKYDLS